MKPRAFALLLLLPLAASAQRPLIGIFESNALGDGNNQSEPGVRVLFYQSGRTWRSYNASCQDEACLKTITHTFPPTTAWNLIKDGKPIATVTAETPAAYHFYSEIGVQAITNPASVANLEPRPTRDQPEQTHIILATTFSTLHDPDNWQPVAVFPLDLTHVREAFDRLYPHPKNCTQNTANSPSNYHTSTTADHHLAPGASYVSSKNWRILQVTLQGYLCDGPPDDAWVDHWFAIAPTGGVHHLGRLMHFSGAADFAHEGHSQLLFQIEGGNQSGYTLFSDNFTHHVHAQVTYH